MQLAECLIKISVIKGLGLGLGQCQNTGFKDHNNHKMQYKHEEAEG